MYSYITFNIKIYFGYIYEKHYLYKLRGRATKFPKVLQKKKKKKKFPKKYFIPKYFNKILYKND